jgi:starvation-inducible DNA-binding protein
MATKTRNGKAAPAASPEDSSTLELQGYGTVVDRKIGLDEEAREGSCEALNGVLADTLILGALYKKHHWLVRGITFYQLHLLLDKHAKEQIAIADELAERIQKLGGIAVGDPRHAAELTQIPRPPNGAEAVPAMLQRLLDAHELVLERVRDAIEKTDDNDDEGSNDLLVSGVLRTNETQVWYIAEHLVTESVV